METCKYQTIRVQNNARLLAKRFDLQLGRESSFLLGRILTNSQLLFSFGRLVSRPTFVAPPSDPIHHLTGARSLGTGIPILFY
jgi:hypothetical protein